MKTHTADSALDLRRRRVPEKDPCYSTRLSKSKLERERTDWECVWGFAYLLYPAISG